MRIPPSLNSSIEPMCVFSFTLGNEKNLVSIYADDTTDTTT